MRYVAERIAASGAHGQTALYTCQEYTCPPAPRKSAATSAGGGKRYSMGCTNHGWHHEPHSPVTNAMCKRWDTPVKRAPSDRGRIEPTITKRPDAIHRYYRQPSRLDSAPSH